MRCGKGHEHETLTEVKECYSVPRGTVQTTSRLPDTGAVRQEMAKAYDVPAGHYAVESLTGNNDLDFFRVDRPTEGRWAGRQFVNRVIGGKPSVAVRGVTALKAAEAIVKAGPEKAAQRYGQEIGRCSRCNRHLTDETSRAAGMGPECRSK
jgi:hypothetical protein